MTGLDEAISQARKFTRYDATENTDSSAALARPRRASIAGGYLLLVANGAGPLSIDNRIAK
jgi:uncharacterized membrane protein YphA (DoxX/SURF4 family)